MDDFKVIEDFHKKVEAIRDALAFERYRDDLLAFEEYRQSILASL